MSRIGDASWGGDAYEDDKELEPPKPGKFKSWIQSLGKWFDDWSFRSGLADDPPRPPYFGGRSGDGSGGTGR